MSERNNVFDPSPYAVICDEHGLQFLTEEQYEEQLSRPDDKWHCPLCGWTAEWDDACYTTNPPDDQTPWQGDGSRPIQIVPASLLDPASDKISSWICLMLNVATTHGNVDISHLPTMNRMLLGAATTRTWIGFPPEQELEAKQFAASQPDKCIAVFRLDIAKQPKTGG